VPISFGVVASEADASAAVATVTAAITTRSLLIDVISIRLTLGTVNEYAYNGGPD